MAIATRRSKSSILSPLVILWAVIWLVFSEAVRGRCRPLIIAISWVWLVWAFVPAAGISLKVGYYSFHENLAVEHILHEDASASRIGRVLLAASGKDPESLQFRLEEADMIAQFIWPRTVTVNPLVMQRYTDDVVAMILAHEIGHWQASTEPLRIVVHSFLLTLSDRTLQLIPFDSARARGEEAFRLGRIALMAGWSRQLERAADEVGFGIYTSAGYAPEAAIVFLEDESGNQIKHQANPNSWTARHPPWSERLARAREQVHFFYEFKQAGGLSSEATYWRRNR